MCLHQCGRSITMNALKTIEELASWAGLSPSLVYHRGKMHGWDWPELLSPRRGDEHKTPVQFVQKPFLKHMLWSYIAHLPKIQMALKVASRQCRPGAEDRLKELELFAEECRKLANEKSRQRRKMLERAELKKKARQKLSEEATAPRTGIVQREIQKLQEYAAMSLDNKTEHARIAMLAEETCVPRRLGNIVRHKQERCVITGATPKRYRVIYANGNAGLAHPYDLYDLHKDEQQYISNQYGRIN